MAIYLGNYKYDKKNLTNMDYKEKYNAALERASKLRVQNPFDTVGQMVEHIFPELKESEDEQSKKFILEYLYDGLRKSDEQFKGQFNAVIAWLEEQGGQKTAVYVPKFHVGDKLVSTKNPRLTYEVLEVGHINELGNPEYKVEIFTDAKAENPHNIHYMECRKVDKWAELIEQKTTDKVEPKFKVGQWIVNNKSNDVFLIKSFNNGYCTLEDIKGNIFSPCELPFEDDYNIWTIEDAKDGDVVITNINTQYEWLGLFKEKTGETFSTHCHYSHYTDKLVITPTRYKNHGCGKYSDIQPATKEQRELLFKKMKEAGWEWDSEKKRIEED